MKRIFAREVLDEFIRKQLTKRSGAIIAGDAEIIDIDIEEEVAVFLEKLCECLDDNGKVKLGAAILQGMDIPTRIQYLIFMTVTVMILNIEGDRKKFLHDFMRDIELLFNKTQSSLPFPSSPPSSLSWH